MDLDSDSDSDSESGDLLLGFAFGNVNEKGKADIDYLGKVGARS